jgi:hypothetical protein
MKIENLLTETKWPSTEATQFFSDNMLRSPFFARRPFFATAQQVNALYFSSY